MSLSHVTDRRSVKRPAESIEVFVARFAQDWEALRKGVDKRRAESFRAIRRKLGLKQAEAGRLFGGGVSAFSEYERGKTQPHKSTVLLLQLLDKHPELLKELSS